MRLLVTRPEPDATALKAQLIGLGHEVLIEPLLRVISHPLDDLDIDLGEAQALIATSRNGLRALARSPRHLEAALHLPVFAVGPGTAGTARALGFTAIVQGPSNAQALVGTIAEQADVNAGPLVYLAGEKRAADIAGELRRLGFHVQEPIVYAVVAAERISPPIAARIAASEIDGVLLMSPVTARIYARLAIAQGLAGPVENIAHICLSAAVAEGLRSLKAPRTVIAAQPNVKSMLALVARGVP